MAAIAMPKLKLPALKIPGLDVRAIAKNPAVGLGAAALVFAGALIVFRAVERQLCFDGGMRPVVRVAGVRH